MIHQKFMGLIELDLICCRCGNTICHVILSQMLLDCDWLDKLSTSESIQSETAIRGRTMSLFSRL